MFNRPKSPVLSASGGRLIPDDDLHNPNKSHELKDTFVSTDFGYFPKRRATSEQIKKIESSRSDAASPSLLHKPSNHF